MNEEVYKPLKIPSGTKIKGLYTYCQKCKSSTMGGKCKLSGKRISSCKHPEAHRFIAKFAVPGTGGKKRMPKTLDTRSLNEAIKQCIAWEEELKTTDYGRMPITKPEKKDKIKPQIMIEAMAWYVKYLDGVGVKKHRRKALSKGHKEAVKRGFRYFCQALKDDNYRHDLLRVDEIDEDMVEVFHDYLLEVLERGAETYNKYMGVLRVWVDWLVDSHKYDLENHFEGCRQYVGKTETKSITRKEFDCLLSNVRPENSLQVLPTCRKYHFKPWLKTAFRIALATGCRREELMKMSYSMLRFDENGEALCFMVPNYKVNRKHSLIEKKGAKMKMVAVTARLKKILIEECDFEKNKHTDKYVLEPDSHLQRLTMMDMASKAFTHFWKHTGFKKKLRMYDLRSTFISSLSARYGDRTNVLTDHAGMEVIKAHYASQELLAEVIRDFDVFGNNG